MPRYATFSSSIKEVQKALRLAEENSAAGAAKEWSQGIVDLMASSVPGGRYYWVRGLGWHRASAPGQVPAIMTGEYIRSVHARREGVGVWSAGSPLLRGLWLEKGTRYMAPRPHIWEGYLANRQNVVGALYKSWEEIS